jgi:hypothetical protein
MALPGLSSLQTWLASFQQPLEHLIDNPNRRSTIPQFIVDASHPWILNNQRKLESLPNAEAFLCSVRDLERNEATDLETKTSGEELEIPGDLFDKLEIDNNRAGISRPGWPNALERLGEMKRCQQALNSVKTLKVEIYVHNGEYSAQYLKILEPSQPPEQLLTLFGDVLESMTNLESLQWGMPNEDAHFFEEAFKLRNLTLPSINHLEPAAANYYLVEMCPNLESLQSGRLFASSRDNRDLRLMLIQAALSANKLSRFAMEAGYNGWTPSLISGMCFPSQPKQMTKQT